MYNEEKINKLNSLKNDHYKLNKEIQNLREGINNTTRYQIYCEKEKGYEYINEITTEEMEDFIKKIIESRTLELESIERQIDGMFK
jgi:flagellar biosynthesis/type III secretory pathway protein FliH